MGHVCRCSTRGNQVNTKFYCFKFSNVGGLVYEDVVTTIKHASAVWFDLGIELNIGINKLEVFFAMTLYMIWLLIKSHPIDYNC